jgi:hypothetical protein
MKQQPRANREDPYGDQPPRGGPSGIAVYSVVHAVMVVGRRLLKKEDLFGTSIGYDTSSAHSMGLLLDGVGRFGSRAFGK